MIAAFMVTGLNAQSPRQGGRGSGPSGQGSERKAGIMALDLTEEQEEAMTTLRTENHKTMTPLKNKMAELKAKERTLLSEESADMKAINKLIDDQTDLMNQMRKIQVTHKIEVKKILSDEQIMKLDQRRKFSRTKGYGAQGRHHGQRMHQGRKNARPYHRNLG